MNIHRLEPFATSHHGLISWPAARAAGISRSTWYRAIAAQHLEQLHPNVARVWGSPETFEQRALAGAWAAGSTAMTSHRTSARLWQVERPADEPIEVLLVSRRLDASPRGVIVHRPRDLRSLRPILRSGVPTTNPLRMLMDLGAVDPDAVPDAMIQLLSTRVVSPAALRSTLFRHSRRGRNGVTAFRTALGSWLDDELPPDSKLEATMAKLVERYRLPAMQFHAIVMGFEVDFLVVGTNVIVECDGWGTHGLNRDQFEFDRQRNGELVAAGYVVINVTWRMLTTSPELAADRIRRAVERWRP